MVIEGEERGLRLWKLNRCQARYLGSGMPKNKEGEETTAIEKSWNSGSVSVREILVRERIWMERKRKGHGPVLIPLFRVPGMLTQ